MAPGAGVCVAPGEGVCVWLLERACGEAGPAAGGSSQLLLFVALTFPFRPLPWGGCLHGSWSRNPGRICVANAVNPPVSGWSFGASAEAACVESMVRAPCFAAAVVPVRAVLRGVECQQRRLSVWRLPGQLRLFGSPGGGGGATAAGRRGCWVRAARLSVRDCFGA